jgi:glycerol-3-phosphate cytidylyltransferase
MKKYKVGYTDGTFDMFHVGHLNLIEAAKSYCEYLIVAVHGDDVVRERKPKGAVICEEDRRRIVAAIRDVDQAEITRFRDKRKLWDLYHFDVIFIGDDYKGTDRWNKFEKDLNEVGVDVIYLPYTKSISSTAIKKRVLEKEKESFPIEAISTDLDGTLLDQQRHLSSRNRHALQTVNRQGIPIILSTGSPYELIPFDQLEGIDISYAITTNGSAIYDCHSKHCIYENVMQGEGIQKIITYLLTKQIHFDIFSSGKAYTPRRCKEIIPQLDVSEARKQYLLQHRIWLNEPKDYEILYQNGVQKITINFITDPAGDLVAYADIRCMLEKRNDVTVTVGVKNNLEITARNVDKGEAMRNLAQTIDIKLENIMAFGDSLNDLPLLTEVGHGVAMENAMPEVLEMIPVHTGTNDDGGVAQEIEKWF